ncbi:hypothetical protein P175DRAFT_0528269 [Aspergillus ochraceoroseus IBT 24754]|uniref:Dimethylallyl tryptophan synthase n=3 Tax=Aspergillus subgen. Nidulantes TaxID=2720870 RepID=A0A0F8U2N4_9EURO|nr:uncharacterized protein P175DRAFT_0528269 [Aspergillus ochraceoroseus IBT 24754]KKK12921.1 hypothetical protein AOCH_000484 [Aspergillus ochraceoroseus]KKK13833.1 hypothetical protein ARAM_001606 [Aspergillus rambellii]PTU24760.1 hypothetical protein P175DRAFT_0528269 [Aspergillus ochraceoroseus IBT 24754]
MTVPASTPTTAESSQKIDHAVDAFNPKRYFWFKNGHEQEWWQRTAPLLARVFQSAQYDLQQQYLYMSLYKTFVVPFLGPYPNQWDSFITYCGVPVEFSINYSDNSPPACRIGWEPVSDVSGTSMDPLNIDTVSKAMDVMSQLHLKDFDTRLFTHFVNTLTLSSEEAAAVNIAELPISRFKNLVSFGLDLKGGEVTVKCYIYPALRGYTTGKSFRELLDHAIQSGGDVMNCSQALNSVHEYLEGAGMYNHYSFIGFDFTAPSKSRLKVYNTIQDITWAKMEDIWTLGGKFAHDRTIQRGLGFAKELWQLLTQDTDKMAVGIWNYELAPGGTVVPNPKWYFILHGQNDMENLEAIVTFYKYLGWNNLAETFIPTVQQYFPHANVAETTTLVQYVSLAYSEKTGVYFSVYYHSSIDPA